jgi:glucokinase
VNIPGAWAERPLAAEVGGALGIPAVLINDARAFGLAELRLGAGRGVRSIVGLTLGTGIGGVVAVDGRVVFGRDGSAGEIGHQTIDPDGPSCGCGNQGCLEAFARGDRIAAACRTATPAEAVERARAGDPAALAGLAEIGRYLGIGIANAIVMVAPDRVVIGGGIAPALDLLLEPIRRELGRRVRMARLDRVEIVPAALGTWAGATGAAIHGAEAISKHAIDAPGSRPTDPVPA